MRYRAKRLILMVGAAFIGSVFLMAPAMLAADISAIYKLRASDGDFEDRFGYSVALDGDTAVMGAYAADDGGIETGAAYVFVYSGGTWSEQAKLTASDAAADDWFGVAVALEGDTALIGAWGDSDQAGSVYVFTRSGGTWTEQDKLTAADAASYDWFGFSVALDGDTALIGAHGDDDNGGFSGSAYLFTRDGGQWAQQDKLTPADGQGGDYFGISVSLDGDTALIGASGENSHDVDAGSAYVFERDHRDRWTEVAKLTASDGAADDLFGYSVYIHGDTAIIGAHGDNDHGSDSGSAYIFVGDRLWTEQAKLSADDGAADDLFGYSVCIHDDAAIIGAYRHDQYGTDDGAAYLFTRSSSDRWRLWDKLTFGDNPTFDRLGFSVAVNGSRVLAGAPNDSDIDTAAGSAIIYHVVLDIDSDGILDDADNCLEIANADQRDTNGDGFGNVCDADLNDDGVINFGDLMLMQSVFFSANPDADFNGDGIVNFADLDLMQGTFFGPPGPSGLVP